MFGNFAPQLAMARRNVPRLFVSHVAVGNQAAVDNPNVTGFSNPPGPKVLSVQETFADVAPFHSGILIQVDLASAPVPASLYGLTATALTDSALTTDVTQLDGVVSVCSHQGSGTVGAEAAGSFTAENDGVGTCTELIGVYVAAENLSTGTVEPAYGLYVDSPLNSGGRTLTTSYGPFLDATSAAAAY